MPKSILKNKERVHKKNQYGHKRLTQIRKSLKKKVIFNMPKTYKDHLCGYD